ncbi:transglycosylase family protein [Streptomyces sp. NPDC058751]|uniref:transglycosylase family protein n=1 Tax=Streptomyces sp. NPDC058751 TaxID=3346623 RepID=UPI00368B0AD8
MLSGNGRHRRPRQAPALIVAAGVTGSAIAIPLLAAASASAADGNTWDKVAQCESGGAWSSDQGNGYYGGLQLDQENWETHGGLEYAPSPDQASRSQQIAVAEKVFADTGLAAWPTCGPLSGLGKGKSSGEVSVDTGVAGDSSSAESDSGSYVSSGLATSPSSSPSGEASASGDADGSSDATGATATPSASQSPDDSDKVDKGDESAKSGKKGASSAPSDASSAGSGRHRGGDAAESAADALADGSTGRHAASPAAEAAGAEYVAEVIDNLWTVSDALGLEGGWGDLPTADTAADDSGPGLVVPGRSIADTGEAVQN